MPWGTGDFKSCDALIQKVANNEIQDLVILPVKRFGDTELDRLSEILETAQQSPLIWKSLAASGHAVSSTACERFGRAISQALISKTCQLESIALGDASLGDAGVVGLASGLQTAQVRTLELSFKNMSAVGLEILSKIDSIRQLDVSRNPIGSTDVTMKIVLQGYDTLNLSACELVDLTHYHISNVKHLILSGNDFGDVGFQTLDLASIVRLNVSGCHLTDDALERLVTNSTIVSLDISNNQISAKGAQLLNAWIQQQNTCTELIVSNNALGDEGVRALCGNNVQFDVLDVSETQCQLSGALEACQSTKCIRFFNNRIDLAGMAGVFELAPQLRQLDVAGNNAPADAIETLLRGLLQAVDTCQLESLIIGGNKCSEAAEALIQQIQSRRKIDVARDKRGQNHAR